MQFAWRSIRLAELGVNAIFWPMISRLPVLAAAVLVAACGSPSPRTNAHIPGEDPAGARRLPTGARLDPAGNSYDLGSMPLAMAMAPEKDRIVVLLGSLFPHEVDLVLKNDNLVELHNLDSRQMLGCLWLRA